MLFSRASERYGHRAGSEYPTQMSEGYYGDLTTGNGFVIIHKKYPCVVQEYYYITKSKTAKYYHFAKNNDSIFPNNRNKVLRKNAMINMLKSTLAVAYAQQGISCVKQI